MRGWAWLGRGLPLRGACGMIAATDVKPQANAVRRQGASMKRILSSVLGLWLGIAATAVMATGALAQNKPPLKLGEFDPARMATVEKFYVDNKLVETAVPIAELYTNDFVG